VIVKIPFNFFFVNFRILAYLNDKIIIFFAILICANKWREVRRLLLEEKQCSDKTDFHCDMNFEVLVIFNKNGEFFDICDN